jgi:hypothetical protein
MAICISTGQELFSHFPVTQGAVLMIDKENSKNLIKDRLTKLGVPGDPPIYFLDEPESFHLSDKETLEWTKKLVKNLSIKVIIIDSFVHIHKGDENDSSAISETFEKLRSLGVAIVFIHHHRKAIKFFTGSVLETIRGSSDIGAELDAHIALDPMGGKLKVTQGKNRWGALLQPFTIVPVITEQTAVFEYAGEISDEASKQQKIEQYIITTLNRVEKASRRTLVDVAQGTGSERTVSEVLKKLEDNGTCVTTFANRQKYYSLSIQGKEAVLQSELQFAKDNE